MTPIRNTVGFCLVAFGLALPACAPSGEQVAGPTSAAVGLAAASEGPGGLDEAFLRVSEIDNDFAGFWIDTLTGELVVSSVRGAEDQLAVGALRQVFATHPRFRRPESMRIERAEYRFMDLQRWRIVVEQQMVKLGLTFIDVDERRNRIHVGARADVSPADILEAIDRMGIPLAAVVMSVREESTPIALLTDKRRPVENGFQVSFSVGAGQYRECSHGGDVLVPGGKGS